VVIGYTNLQDQEALLSKDLTMIFSGLTIVGGFTVAAPPVAPTGGSNFIGQLGALNTVVPLLGGQAITGDSDGNLYVAGDINDLNYDASLLVAKYDNTGTIQWQRRLSGASTSRGYGIAVDSSGNVYVCGVISGSTQNGFLAKWNSSGTLQWQKALDGNALDTFNAIKVDSSGNSYIVGTSNVSSLQGIQIVKYDTSGNVTWQRRLAPSSGKTASGSGVGVDSSGNVYVFGQSNNVTNQDLLLAKYNSSGTLQWQKRLYTSGGYTSSARGLAVDSDGNSYFCGYSNAYPYTSIVAKYDTSGSLQWQRTVTEVNGVQAQAVVVDSSSNVYFLCGIDFDHVIIKWNSSGTVQWQREMAITDAGEQSVTALGIGPDSKYYTSGFVSDNDFNYSVLFTKLPTDGTQTGTYAVSGIDYAYSTTSQTITTSTFTDATTSLTSSTSTLTATTPSLTNTTTTLTSTVTTL
jgi:hypothetical protein